MLFAAGIYQELGLLGFFIPARDLLGSKRHLGTGDIGYLGSGDIGYLGTGDIGKTSYDYYYRCYFIVVTIIIFIFFIIIVVVVVVAIFVIIVIFQTISLMIPIRISRYARIE